jgi:putative nucleotidyltransferase with HDIG domain
VLRGSSAFKDGVTFVIGQDEGLRIEQIPVGRIRGRALPSRREGTDDEIRRLAASIKRHGLLHPLLVRPAGRSYEIVCGQRRYRACRSLGWGEVPAIVRPLDERQALELSIAENARREGLSPEDRRSLLRRLGDLFPGRNLAELESWLGPADAPTAPDDDALPVWLERLPDTEVNSVSVVVTGDPAFPPPSARVLPGSDTKVLVAPSDMVQSRRSLVSRVRILLNKLTKSGRLDSELLGNIIRELFQRLEQGPLHEFLDLSYRARTKRYVTRHCLNVAKLAMFLARELGLPKAEIEQIGVCGLLHDIGMMKVKDEVFTKHAALDQEEWEQVKGHPVEGALLLTKEVVLRDVVARVALEHHEKPDGSGYPKGKKKEEIHLYARLINVVDTYGAMVSPRAHRLPLLPHQAMKVVMDDGAKGMLDWDLVHSFVKAMSVYPVGSYVRLEGGEIARVVRASAEIPEKPVIAVVADAQRNIFRIPVEIDLAMTEPTPKFEPIPSPI